MSEAPQARSSVGRIDLTGGTAGRFTIQRRLGAGGMGEVYLAEDPKLRRLVAIKRMSPGKGVEQRDLARILREGQRASALNHPNIANVFDVIEEDGELLLVMEYIEGTTLREHLINPMEVEQFYPVAVQCVDALACAHEKGIVHGDIKPENIMITAANQVKLLDFGLARRVPGAEGSTAALTMSLQDIVGGSPSYMPPEVLMGGLPDRRADVFALGLVFYEMLTANHPFRGPSLASTSDRILHEEPRPLHKLGGHVPKDLAALIAKALCKAPEWRYASAKELAGDLNAVMRHAPVKISGPPRRLPRKTMAAAAVVVLLAAVVFAVHPLRERVVAFVSGGARGMGSLGAPAEPINLAVLPVQVTGGDAELKAFGDGLAESVTAKLSQLSENRNLQVVTPSQMLAKKVTTPAQAMQSFGSNRGLKITLARSGALLRAGYTLLDASSGNTLAGGTVTAPATDPFTLEDKVADGVVSALHIKLHTDEKSLLTAHGTAQPAANDYYLQGLGYLQTTSKPENAANAITVLDQAIQLDPMFGLAYAARGQADLLAYERNKSAKLLKNAAADCGKAIELGNAGARGHICSGGLATQSGEYDQAAMEFKRAAELEPSNDDAYIGLGQSYEKLRRIDDAEQAYQRIVSLRPQYWRGYDLLAQFYIKQAQYEKAVPMYKKVIELAPESFIVYSNLAGVYLFLGQPAQAIPLLEHSIKIRPLATTYSNLGTAYFQLKRFEDAAHNYEQATRLDAANYPLWGNLGDAYQAEGKRDSAKQAYAKELELVKPQLQANPHDPDLQADIASTYANLGDKANALKYLDQSLSRASDDKDHLFNAAVIYNQLGESGLALEWLDKALRAGYSPSVIDAAPSLDNLRSDPRFKQLLLRYAAIGKK